MAIDPVCKITVEPQKAADSGPHEIRFHGRGGQGVVSAAALLSLAAFDAGFEAQAFPKFGSERRGAPVEAYVRISATPIRAHNQVYQPEAVQRCRPQVIATYPITPQTYIIEHLAQMVADGELAAEFISAESEFAAASLVLGAVAGGERAFTASAA